MSNNAVIIFKVLAIIMPKKYSIPVKPTRNESHFCDPQPHLGTTCASSGPVDTQVLQSDQFYQGPTNVNKVCNNFRLLVQRFFA